MRGGNAIRFIMDIEKKSYPIAITKPEKSLKKTLTPVMYQVPESNRAQISNLNYFQF